MMSEPPSFSVVVATCNRPAQLARLLSSLSALEYPPTRFEVILVDDGGDVPLEPVVSGFHNQFTLVLLRQDNAGPGAARNCGAAQASGEYLAFTDDDCMAEPNWLEALAAALRESPRAACGGSTVNALSGNVYSTATQLLVEYLYEHYQPGKRLGAFFPTCNLALPRAAFLEMGGFEPALRFGEDRDFCYRWASRGHPSIAAPAAVIRHAHYLTLLSFLRLHFSYGRGTWHFWRRHIAGGSGRGVLSGPSWYVNLLLFPIKRERNPRGLLLSLLLVAAQGASTMGFFWAGFEGLVSRGK
jgi:GT2 family glycosyltransferase